ncbi:MAG: PqqD family protein [Clostridia bacterium]|nr:PqqD family protein [Clostridia bacterium]
MKIKENYMLRKVADCYVVVPIGAAVAEFNGMINLNEVGAFLWRQLESDTTPEAVLAAMLEEYEVAEDIAKADLDKFINELQEANLLA